MTDLIERLRTRAAIRRKATCRGAEDRLANVLDEAADAIDVLTAERDLKQARIDWLMLEYCPGEMTEEQTQNWAKHQVPAPEQFSPRDWPGDFSQENGRYSCRCVGCKKLFEGHKRRIFCRECHTRLPEN